MDDKIVSLKKKNPKMAVKVIAAKVGVHPHRVYKVLNSKLPGWVKYNGMLSRVPLIVKLKADNPEMSLREIARKVGVSYQRVYQVCNAHLPGWC